jgi:DNA-binding NtrC family response regulator
LDAGALGLLVFVKERCPDAPAILMAGYGDPATMQKAFDMGASCCFGKPVEMQILSRAIRELAVPTAVA